jgi:iron(III) transport system substrate-binding protein
MRNLKMVGMVSIVAMTAILATGCGAKPNVATDSSAPSSSASSNISTATAPVQSTSAPKDKELVFYSAEGFDKDIATAFEKKTGIKVNLVDDSTGPLLAKMQAEKSNPQWDVAWFDGPSSMQGLDNQGMLYKDYVPSNTANYTDLGKKLLPSDHAFFPVTVTAAAAIGYNTNLMKDAALPKDWSDLLKPAYKGAFAMNNPSISGPTYTTVLGLMQLQGGIPQGEDFFTKLKANGLNVFDSNGPTLTNLSKGIVKFALAQDSAILDKINKKEPIQIIYPASGVTTLSSNTSIDAKAPHMEAAKMFVDYILSVEGQKVASSSDDGDAYFQSIIQGAPGKEGIRPDGIKWNTEDPVYGAEHENEVKQWFTKNIVQK